MYVSNRVSSCRKLKSFVFYRSTPPGMILERISFENYTSIKPIILLKLQRERERKTEQSIKQNLSL